MASSLLACQLALIHLEAQHYVEFGTHLACNSSNQSHHGTVNFQVMWSKVSIQELQKYSPSSAQTQEAAISGD